MQTTINGHKLANLDEAAIAQALQALPVGKRVRIHCQGNGRTVYAVGKRGKGFMLAQLKEGQYLYSEQRDLDDDSVAWVLGLFVGGEAKWETAVNWQSGADRYKWSKIPVGIAAFFIFAIPYTIWMVVALRQNSPGTPTLTEALLGYVAIAAIAAYIGYVEFFFKTIRPFLAAWLSQKLGVQVEEDTDDMSALGGAGAGTWDARGGLWHSRLLLHLLDLVILVMGLVGPVAVVSITAFLLADGAA